MLHLRSAEPPFDDAAVAGQAARLLVLAEATGAWTPPHAATVLDTSLVNDALGALRAVGVGTGAAFEMESWAKKSSDAFAQWLLQLRDALEASALPETELPKLATLFGTEHLAALVGVGTSTLRRYLARQRAVPDDVAHRLHVVARIVGALAGMYNDRGIRRWFDRPRRQLGGLTPAEALVKHWSDEQFDADDVVMLASAPTGT